MRGEVEGDRARALRGSPLKKYVAVGLGSVSVEVKTFRGFMWEPLPFSQRLHTPDTLQRESPLPLNDSTARLHRPHSAFESQSVRSASKAG